MYSRGMWALPASLPHNEGANAGTAYEMSSEAIVGSLHDSEPAHANDGLLDDMSFWSSVAKEVDLCAAAANPLCNPGY